MQEAVSTPASSAVGDEEVPGTNDGHLSQPQHHGNTLLMKIIGPVITFVDRPWKVSGVSTWSKTRFGPRNQMYPVGLLFGFGKAIPYRRVDRD